MWAGTEVFLDIACLISRNIGALRAQNPKLSLSDLNVSVLEDSKRTWTQEVDPEEEGPQVWCLLDSPGEKWGRQSWFLLTWALDGSVDYNFTHGFFPNLTETPRV